MWPYQHHFGHLRLRLSIVIRNYRKINLIEINGTSGGILERMYAIQKMTSELLSNGWTLAATADEVKVTRNTVVLVQSGT